MLKVAALIHLLAATVIAGILVLVITATPSLMDNAMRYIPWALFGGIVLAVPPSIWAAKAILKRSNGL